MEQLYDKILLTAGSGKGFSVVLSENGTLTIQVVTNHLTENVYSGDYKNPPIPEGYKHVCGDWYNGYVIEQQTGGSQFVWIPVGVLEPTATLEGNDFCEKFGRTYSHCRNFDCSFWELYEKSDELDEQLRSVKKYGGFYLSRYNISKSSEGAAVSKKGFMPWTNVDFDTAMQIAATIENNDAIKSHLPFGAEYDSVLRWFLESKTHFEIFENSFELGNYRKHGNIRCSIVHTGSNEDWCVNNIYDIAGNVCEWTQEKYGHDTQNVYRGGSCNDYGCDAPMADRWVAEPSYESDYIGFRAALTIT